MYGQINIWLDRFMYRQIYVQINTGIDRYMDRQIYGYKDICIDGCMYREIDICIRYMYRDIFIYIYSVDQHNFLERTQH